MQSIVNILGYLIKGLLFFFSLIYFNLLNKIIKQKRSEILSQICWR